MIMAGVLLVVIGLILWLVGRLGGPPVVLSIGQACIVVGGVLLLVWLLLVALTGGIYT